MTYSTLALSRDGAIAEIRLDRPDDGNPIDDRFLAELERVVSEIHADPSVSVVLLTAAGHAFSRGWAGDVPKPGAHAPLPFRSIELMAQPVIACIEGDAIGAGLEITLACDIRIGAEGATFAVPDVAAGHIPAFGATQRLPRIVGPGKAAEMILLGDPLDAGAALACGLLNAVTAPGQVLGHARRLAGTIASRGPIAVRYAKEAITRGLDMPLDQALRFETDLTVILQTTADRAEGVRAFLEKRDPDFRGA
jgi:enoyl-CoA hydratase